MHGSLSTPRCHNIIKSHVNNADFCEKSLTNVSKVDNETLCGFKKCFHEGRFFSGMLEHSLPEWGMDSWEAGPLVSWRPPLWPVSTEQPQFVAGTESIFFKSEVRMSWQVSSNAQVYKYTISYTNVTKNCYLATALRAPPPPPTFQSTEKVCCRGLRVKMGKGPMPLL